MVIVKMKLYHSGRRKGLDLKKQMRHTWTFQCYWLNQKLVIRWNSQNWSFYFTCSLPCFFKCLHLIISSIRLIINCWLKCTLVRFTYLGIVRNSVALSSEAQDIEIARSIAMTRKWSRNMMVMPLFLVLVSSVFLAVMSPSLCRNR